MLKGWFLSIVGARLGGVRGFLNFLFGREILFYFTQLRIGERLFAPVCLLHLYYTILDLICQEVFQNFFNFFGGAGGIRTHILRTQA